MAKTLFPFDVGHHTDTGRTRDTNEDSLVAVQEWCVFVVADGVGGLAAGDVASQKVCETMEETCGDFGEIQPLTAAFINSRLRAAVNKANDWIRDEAERRESRGMGTTMVALFFDPDKTNRAICLHVGDSRLYRLRDGVLTQLTVDHSIAGQLGVDEAELHPYMQGVITRAVGIQADVSIEETAIDVCPGDVFLVCSDGLTRMINDQDLTGMMTDRPNTSINEQAARLVREANDAGGYDNISVILVRVPKD